MGASHCWPVRQQWRRYTAAARPGRVTEWQATLCLHRSGAPTHPPELVRDMVRPPGPISPLLARASTAAMACRATETEAG